MRHNSQRMKINHNHSGFLLIEAILAVVILAFSLTLIVQSMGASLRASFYSSQYTTAVFLADHQMFEWLRGRFIGSGVREEGTFSSVDGEYKYSFKTENVPVDDQPSALNLVELDVSWPARQGQNQVSLATYLFNTPFSEK